MSLLWTVAKGYHDEDESYLHPASTYAEDHEQHGMHPAFEAAGIKEAPCAFSLCDDVDWDHSDAFDEAERRFRKGDYEHGHVDLTKPVYGFETTADMHTIRRYTTHPQTRQGDPAMFIHKGKQYIFDGHHGISGGLRRGDASMPAAVVNLDKER